MKPWSVVRLYCLVLLLGTTGLARADAYFEYCEFALPKPEFKPLLGYLQSHLDIRPNQCFRINNYQFLMTITDAGRVSQGLYYFDAKLNEFGLSQGRQLPNLGEVREFEGKNAKRYVLLPWSNLHRGGRERGFDVLYLAPKKNNKSYTHYNLLVASEDAELGFCGGKKSDSKTTFAETPRIEHEGTEKLQIVFPVIEEDCKTLERRSYERTFQFRKGMFRESTVPLHAH